ncbi:MULTISPECIES: DUF2884 family protein [unclassified Colwellia]|uniref:DUF2884 family protein n=1 Tax=unclassified Colwellia TaxID=196834 RepID=UPI0015F40C80|nr:MULTISPECIES: DUF2884 family protein [unclassified Colwellia]MBA6232009.1 YggN family protein [Colwellia sp. MB02u-7]MBA6236611.1 YggN family protein [Colwellia sp. MB02u-11]MBA6254759.1 YggN family protein [Colwellia sp. MB3u-28]MBA6259269.1 YggN family protein [Colwellia sp. MB3u-41]MBA6298940.1 YggN family protein [Colwellia sp. MB3u-22]
MNSFTLPLLAIGMLISSASAQQCDINFNHGVVINPSHVRILKESQTYVQINNDQQLFIRGREINLNEEQRQLLTQYSQGIRKQIPEIVAIAIEGVDIDLKAVNKVIAGLTGENSASHQKIQERFDEMQYRLRERFNHSDTNYYIASQDFADFDEIFAGAFEQEIESIVTESIGTILMAVDEAMATNEESSSEQRVETFDQRIKGMEKDLQLEIEPRAQEVQLKAAQFCKSLKKLDQLEAKLQQSITALGEFDLIQTK